MDILNNVWGFLTDTLENVFNWILGLLPDSPFQALSTSVISEYLGILNWFFPFDFVLATMQAWLTAIGLYYVVSAVMRWVKAIE